MVNESNLPIPKPGWSWWLFHVAGSAIVSDFALQLDAPEDGEYGVEFRMPGQESRWSNRINLLAGQRAMIERFDPVPQIIGVLGGAAPGPLPATRDPDERIAELLKSNNELRDRAMAAEIRLERVLQLLRAVTDEISRLKDPS